MRSQVERIFDGYGYLASAISAVVDDFEPFKYSFMPAMEYRDLVQRETDPYESDRICLTEILQRAHLAATTSLVRADRWIKGIYQADDANNYLVFAAALRAYLNLERTPTMLSQRCHALSRSILKKCSSVYIVSHGRTLIFSNSWRIG